MDVRVLVVEDDAGIRRLLVALLRERFDCLTTEVSDGVEALVALRKAPPHAVILDIGLPLMDGIELLEVLRAEPSYAAMPVVVVSGVGDATSVRKAIALGAADFLVKPIRLQEVENRLRLVFDRLRQRATQGPAPVPGASRLELAAAQRSRILLIDRDINFRQAVSTLLDGKVSIVAAEHGADGLRHYVQFQPHIVCIGEGLSLPNERLLARKMRALEAAVRSRVYLCADRGELSGEEAQLFDGLVRRSFVPERLHAEFARLLVDDDVLYGPLRRLLRGELAPEIVTAARQTLGFTTMDDIVVLPVSAASGVACEVGREIDLTVAEDANVVVRVTIAGSRDDVERLATRMLGTPATIADGAGEALGELLNIIAGRLSASFDVRGIRLSTGLPRALAATQPTPEVVLPFAAASVARLVLTVSFPNAVAAAPGSLW